MSFVSLIMTEEAALSCVRELGILGCIQFVDLNPEMTAFQREYVASIKRCDEIERKIRYIYVEVKRLGLSSSSSTTVEDFISNARRDSIGSGSGSGAYILETLETRIENYENRMKELVDYNAQLSGQYTRKVEYHHLLVQANKIVRAVSEIELKESAAMHAGFSGAAVTGDVATIEDGATNPLLTGGGGSSYQDAEVDFEHAGIGGAGGEELAMSFSNISGVLSVSDRNRFERMLFRASRGNCYVRFAPLSATGSAAVDADGNVIEKLAFVIFYKSATIENKIARICDAFGATRYDLGMLNRPRELESVRRANYQELLDSKAILDKNTNVRYSLCAELADSLEEWLWVVRREKSVYHTLNLFKTDVAGRLIRAQGWIVTTAVSDAKQALHRAHLLLNLPQNSLLERVSGAWPTPPTHFKTNKFTFAYQEFVNTYGMPRYREINPALFTAATFPFLFGVMYGDIGHATVLSIAAFYLVLTENKLRTNKNMDDMLKNLYAARYMLLAMGVCSIYAGLIYNDYFSLGLDIFGTKYEFTKPEDELIKGDRAVLKDKAVSGDPSAVYPFGMDPVWHVSSNELLFFNSMKMKMSVILGITHMTWGIILRGVNNWYIEGFGLDFFAEFLPMIIFDVLFFGYMVALIFIKWSINWDERMAMGSCQYDSKGNFGACHLSSSQKTCYSIQGHACTVDTPLVDICPLDFGGTGDGCQPSNLIITLINIALKPGQVDDPLYAGQAGVQVTILGIAMICVPWLLCVKPYFLYKAHQDSLKSDSLHSSGSGHGAGARLMDNMSDHNAGYDEADEVHSPLNQGQEQTGIEMREFNAASTYGNYNFSSNITNAPAGEEASDYMQTVDTSSYLSGNGAYDPAGAGAHGGSSHGEEEEFNFPEIFIHQAIETIEFVLGMVSNTASYLRLWALSLAHTELSKVFWEKCLLGPIESGNPIAIFMGFGVFAAITTAVLLFMDVLECFLHALRLHWVEFQNKFYKADGYRFLPFDFTEILSHAKLDH